MIFHLDTRLLSKLLKGAMQRHGQTKMAIKLEPEGFVAKRVCPDPIRMVINSGWARKCKLEAFTAVKAFCGGIWTTTRAAAAGYIIEDVTCPLCHEEEDTIEHRLLRCPKCKVVRDGNKSTCKIIRDNIKTNKLLATRGIMAHPADDARLPPSEGGITVTRSGFNGDPNDLLQEVGGDWGFCDGSASRHPVEELRRAAWAAAFLDSDGNEQVKITGPVWANLPQPPQAAEYIGAVAAIKVMTRPTTLVGDCLGMIHSVNRIKASCAPEGAYGGVLRSIARGGRFSNLTDFIWTPAHTVLRDDATPRERLLHKGNDLVDAGAKDARLSIEENTGDNVLKDADADCRRAVRILKTVGTILAQWPAMARGMDRCKSIARGQLTIGHEWSFAPQLGYWRCCDCGLFSHNSATEGPPLTAGPCKPGRVEQRNQEAVQLGHTISSVAGCRSLSARLAAYTARGGWDRLLKPCTGAPANYQASLWLSKASKGEEIMKQLSRKQALAVSKVSRKYSKMSQKVTVTESKGYGRSQKATIAEPNERGTSSTPLRNKLLASLEIKKEWEARLFKPPREPAPKGSRLPRAPPGSAVAAADGPAQPGHPQAFQPPQPVLRLMPWSDDPEAPEESCPQCSATVLPSDWLCAQCGLGRADAVEETAATPVASSAREYAATQAGQASAAYTQDPSTDFPPENLFPSGIATTEAINHPGHSAVPRPPLKSALKGRGSTGSRPRPGIISFGPNPPTATIASLKSADLPGQEGEGHLVAGTN